MFEDKISFNIISMMVLCSLLSFILNLSIYVQYNILAVKNICKNKTFVHHNIFLFKSLCRLASLPAAVYYGVRTGCIEVAVVMSI